MRLTLTALLSLALAAPLAAGPSGWRVDNTGKFPEVKAPTTWSPTTNVVWKTELADWSNATPVHVDGKLYLCAEPDSLLCVRLKDGKLLWSKRTTDESGRRPMAHRVNGYTSATPATDGKHLWMVFGSGVTACYDLDGNRKWAVKVGTPNHRWGHSASPVLVGGTVYAHVSSTLHALDAATGKSRWTVASRMAWGSPAVTTVGKTRVLVMPNGEVIRASDGKKLATGLGRLTYGTPVIQDGVAYFIDPRATAVKLESDGADGVKTTRLWSNEIMYRRARFYASPVIHDGLIYSLEQRNSLVVLDAKTGEKVYTQRLNLGRGTCYPSLVLAGKVLYAGSDNGTTVVFAPGRSFKQIASNRLETTRACIVFADGKMIVRGYRYLYCIAGDAKATTTPPARKADTGPLKLDPKKTYY